MRKITGWGLLILIWVVTFWIVYKLLGWGFNLIDKNYER